MEWWAFDYRKFDWRDREDVQSRILQALGWKILSSVDRAQQKYTLTDTQNQIVYYGYYHAIRRVIQDATLVPQYTIDYMLVSGALDEYLFRQHPFGYYTLIETREVAQFKVEMIFPTNMRDVGRIEVVLDTNVYAMHTVRAYALAILFLRVLQVDYERLLAKGDHA